MDLFHPVSARILAALILFIGFGVNQASAQVQLQTPGLYDHSGQTVVTNANGDPLGESLSHTSMWILCLDVHKKDPFLSVTYNLSEDHSIIQSGVWENIPTGAPREDIFQSIANMFFNNQALITSTPYQSYSGNDNPIFAFQKASWILIHDYADNYYTGTFDSTDLANLYLRDENIEGSLVDDFLKSSAMYHSATAGRVYFGEAADPNSNLQPIMLITADPVITPVPEPSAALLAIVGGSLLLGRRRR